MTRVGGRGARLRPRAWSAYGTRHEGEGGAEPLAAGADEVGGDLGEERIGRLDRVPQRGVDPDEVVGQGGQVAARSAGPGGRSGSPGPVMRPRYAATGTISKLAAVAPSRPALSVPMTLRVA